MPIPLILAAVEITTLLEGFGVITTGAVAIALSPDNDEVQKKIDDKIHEYESVASGGEIGVIDGDEDSNGNRSGGAAGAVAGATIGAAAIESSKGCQDCPAIPHVIPHERNITNTRSPNAYKYQARICNIQIRTIDTPAGQLKYIDEWLCTIPVPTRTKNPLVEFDGWKPEECNFIETKDNYEFFFNSKGKPNKFMEEDKKILKQATEQNWLCSSQFQRKSFIDWHFSHEKMFNLCTELLEPLSQVRTHYSP